MCWRSETGAATLNATATRAPIVAQADLNLSELSCIRHVVIEADNLQRLLVHTTDAAIAIELSGAPIVEAPVNVRFHVDGLLRATTAGSMLIRLPEVLATPSRRVVKSVRRNLLRNALLAVDGRHAGASYRDMANVAFGQERAATAWNSPSRAIKDQMIRAFDKGADLVDGGYQQLLR